MNISDHTILFSSKYILIEIVIAIFCGFRQSYFTLDFILHTCVNVGGGCNSLQEYHGRCLASATGVHTHTQGVSQCSPDMMLSIHFPSELTYALTQFGGSGKLFECILWTCFK